MPFNTFGTMHMTSGLMQTADVKRCVCISSNANPEDLHCGILLKENGPHCGHETCRLCRMTQKKKKKKSPKGIYQTATAHLMCTSLVCYNHTRCHLKKPPSASYLQPDLVYSLYKPRKLHLNYACAATGPRATRVKKTNKTAVTWSLTGVT